MPLDCGGVRTHPSYRPYPWYYAVNDRPVKLIVTPDGGLDCHVLDMKTGLFCPDRSYFAFLSPGPGNEFKDVDQLDEAGFDGLVMSARARIVHNWCVRLCHAESYRRKDLEAALAVAFEPAPLGAESVYVGGQHLGFGYVQLRFRDRTLTRDAIDRELGSSHPLPQVDVDSTHTLGYSVAIPGARYRVAVFASFDSRPSPQDYVRELTWRLDPPDVIPGSPRARPA